jgi:hypothetical protein
MSKKGTYVSRAAFAKMQADRDRLKKALYIITMGGKEKGLKVFSEWRQKFLEEQQLNELLREYARKELPRLVKDYPSLAGLLNQGENLERSVATELNSSNAADNKNNSLAQWNKLSYDEQELILQEILNEIETSSHLHGRLVIRKLIEKDDKVEAVAFGEWQVCPICNGSGEILADGYTSSVYQQCPTCSGNRIIQRPTIQNL